MTYDFSSTKKYSTDVPRTELRNEFNKMLAKGMDESKTLKVFELDIDASLLNKAFSVIREDFVYQIGSYTVNGITFKIRGKNLIINFHIVHNGTFKYKFKVGTVFSFTEEDSRYILSLRRTNVGGFIIPSYILNNVLSNEEEDSLGSIIENTLNSVEVGTFNKEDLTYIINKSEIVESVRDGSIGELIFEDNEESKNTFAFFISTMLYENLINISVNNKLLIKVDYSKIINKEPEYSDIYLKAMSNNDYDIGEYSLLYKYLNAGGDLSISSDFLSLYFSKKYKDIYNEESEGFLENINLKDAYLSYNKKILSIKLILSFDEYVSVVEPKFKESNKSFVFDSATIGYDENESASFIEIKRTYEISLLIELLRFYGLEIDNLTKSLNIESFVQKPQFTGTINYSDNIYFYNYQNPYKNEILNASLSDDLYSTLNSDINDKLDHSSLNSLLASFDYLSSDEMRTVIVNLRDYFIESNNLVYNYIDGFIGGD